MRHTLPLFALCSRHPPLEPLVSCPHSPTHHSSARTHSHRPLCIENRKRGMLDAEAMYRTKVMKYACTRARRLFSFVAIRCHQSFRSRGHTPTHPKVDFSDRTPFEWFRSFQWTTQPSPATPAATQPQLQPQMIATARVPPLPLATACRFMPLSAAPLFI